MSRCHHARDVVSGVVKSGEGCVECLAAGTPWVHLRECLVCGHVGCCDSSIGRHAAKHFHASGHPVMKSLERGESWGWCYVDEVMLTV